MPLPRPDKGLQNLKRYQQIARILIKYGFGEIVYRMNLVSPLRPGKARKKTSIGKSTPVRVRLALEELGPTFVKLGQVLSTRPFLLPVDYILELSKLQDQVEPMPWPQASKMLVSELGRPIEECFKEFDQVPLASASLAQVHDARLLDGTPVVVKVQREGIRKIIDSDMNILYDVADLLEKNIQESRQYDPRGVVEELARTTRKEINFLNEARNIEIFSENFSNEPGVKIPRVYRKFTTPKLLTLEKIVGIKISNVDELEKAGYDTEQICKNGSRLVLKMIFEDGFFHADPHPGNLFVCENEVIAPVDFGMMGTLSESQMNELADFVVTVMSRDARDIVRVLQNSGVVPEKANLKALEQDLSEMIVKYYRMSLTDIDMKSALDDFFAISHRYEIKFQVEFMLLGKALMTYEELARMLYPEYNFVAEIGPYLTKLTARKFKPTNFLKDIMRIIDELRWIMVESPRKWRLITDKLSRGELQVQMQHIGLETFIKEMDRSSNRLSVSLLVAALIVGSSMIMTVDKGVMIFELPVLGLIGYLFAGILGILLVISILRSGKL
ncbi:MAG: AarF/ABC1/UbiB kinase family protein [candidate division Zixibacteria bacterium]|nr:AarF/ABC1/UbiB kinase family protein [candidate division Zixibacteria bacterium]